MGDTSGEKLDVLLYGLGAIGSYYSIFLANNPRVKLTLCARSNYEAVKKNGLSMVSKPHDAEYHSKAFEVVRTPAEAQQTFDYIVCVNKAVDTDAVLEQLKPAVDEERTTIAIMQNGVGNEVPFRKAFPGCTIISGVIWIGAQQESPGFVRNYAAQSTELGLHPKDPDAPTPTEAARLTTLSDLFTEGGTFISIPPNISTARWKKAIWNMAWNSLTTLIGNHTTAWLTPSTSSDLSEPVTRKLMLEAVAVAKATGVPDIDESLPDELLARAKTIPEMYSSMYHDREALRPMEIEVILGHAVREGRRVGSETPTLDCLYALLAAIDKKMKAQREQAKKTQTENR